MNIFHLKPKKAVSSILLIILISVFIGVVFGVLDYQFHKKGTPLLNFTLFSKEDNLRPFRDNSKNKWGYIDKTGRIVIEPKYDDASDFQKKIAHVRLNDECYSINTKGEIIKKEDCLLFFPYPTTTHPETTTTTTEEPCFEGNKAGVFEGSLKCIKDELLKKLIIEKFIDEAKFVCGKKNIGDVDKFKFRVDLIDLNNDGVLEYIIIPSGTESCGLRGASDNGPIDVYGLVNGNWKLIGELNGNTVKPRETYTNGYLDLLTHWHLSAVSGDISEYLWNGEKYLLIKSIEYNTTLDEPLPKEYYEMFPGR